MGRSFFGADPETYDAVRPGHAREVYDVLRDRCGLRPGSSVLEIGPGTGQATRRLLELGARPLVAIEPDPVLASYLRARVGDLVDVRATTLEEADLESAEFDLATAASSFHWVDEDAGLAKLRHTLRRGGWVALWWTSFGDEQRADPFRAAVDPLFANVPHGPSGPPEEGRPSHARDVEARVSALERAGFAEPEGAELRWPHEWDAEGIRGLYSTFSPLSALDPDERQRFLDDVARIAEVEFGGRVTLPLVTSLYTARTPD